MESWINKSWLPLIKGGLTFYACGKVFFCISFSSFGRSRFYFSKWPLFLRNLGTILESVAYGFRSRIWYPYHNFGVVKIAPSPVGLPGRWFPLGHWELSMKICWSSHSEREETCSDLCSGWLRKGSSFLNPSLTWILVAHPIVRLWTTPF